MAAIRTIVLKDGSKRYRFTVDTGRDPETGKRRQTTMTFGKLKDASAELARVGHQSRTGEYVARSRETVSQLCDAYLRSATFEKEAATESCYRHALKPARERLGGRQAQSISRRDIEDLRDWMLTAGRKRGGQPGTGVGARSVRLTIGRLSAAFEQACDDGKLYRNPCRSVKLPALAPKELEPWSKAEVGAFLAAASGDRLHAAWLLSLYGMRREEVCGLRWSDVDLQARTLTIVNAHPVVDGHVRPKGPKSQRSKRTLPLDDDLAAALKALRKLQLGEQLAAGPAYEQGSYVVTDELGRPVNPEWYSDEFHRVRTRAGVRRITLRNVRDTGNSLMAAAGIADHVRAAWCGHEVQVNNRVYTHARPEDLVTARDTLARIYKIE
jgi:integrase